jgi:hypothetical protein
MICVQQVHDQVPETGMGVLTRPIAVADLATEPNNFLELRIPLEPACVLEIPGLRVRLP